MKLNPIIYKIGFFIYNYKFLNFPLFLDSAIINLVKNMNEFLKKYERNDLLIFINKLLKRFKADDILSYGASLTYFLILSIFPFLIALINAINFLDIVNVENVLELIEYFPLDIKEIVKNFFVELNLTSSSALTPGNSFVMCSMETITSPISSPCFPKYFSLLFMYLLYTEVFVQKRGAKYCFEMVNYLFCINYRNSITRYLLFYIILFRFPRL